jgi:FixJ family two-component response regulator
MECGEVFVVDDDPTLLSAMGYILRRAGLGARTFAQADLLLREVATKQPICVLLDVLMPSRSGLDVLSDLKSRGYSRPVVMMSGAGDIPMAVEAMRRGAINFITKPFSSEELVGTVKGAMQTWQQRHSEGAAPFRTDFPGHALLTRRERDILERIAAGATAKEAALLLEISPRTVEFYRARIFQKLGAKNSADLMRIVMHAAA